MFFSEDEPDLNNELEISVKYFIILPTSKTSVFGFQNFKLQTAETVEAIVSQLMEKQRVARQAALVSTFLNLNFHKMIVNQSGEAIRMRMSRLNMCGWQKLFASDAKNHLSKIWFTSS